MATVQLSVLTNTFNPIIAHQARYRDARLIPSRHSCLPETAHLRPMYLPRRFNQATRRAAGLLGV